LPHNTVLEVLENVGVDAELVAACRRLRAEGFRIALDDYDFGEQWEPLLPYTDFVKIDFRSSTSADRCKLIKRFEHQSIRFVAEKIEDGTEFEIALKEGFHLFQGYFFTRPVVLARPALSHVVGKVRLMNELRQPDLNYARVISILKEESSIAYRLLRLANSAVMGRREPLIDLTTALRFVGEDTFRMLAFTALTTELCGKQPLEAHRVILQTARFCEQMNATICCEGSELYTFGMLSVVKSILNLSVEALARAVTLDPEMMDALAGEDNSYSRLLRCFSSFESGEWDRFRLTCVTLGSTEEDVIETALAAQRWADDVLTAAA
jgi:EAL and modified HD-GYP domain-containing signal transduction protein